MAEEKERTEEEPLVQRQRTGRWSSEIASCGARLGPHTFKAQTQLRQPALDVRPDPCPKRRRLRFKTTDLLVD